MEKQNELYETIDKIAKANVLLYAVMESDGDLIKEPYGINRRKYNGFYKAIEILCDLKAKGKCDFEAMDIRKEYTMHSIEVKWNLTDDFYVYIDESNKSEIKALLDCMDECIISDDDATKWSFISRIFVPKSEFENNNEYFIREINE